MAQLLRKPCGATSTFLVDMLPGMGTTLAQRATLSGAVLPTAGHRVLDARKGIEMFPVEVPVLGLIENMAAHVCTQCGHVEPLGEAGGEQLATAGCRCWVKSPR